MEAVELDMVEESTIVSWVSNDATIRLSRQTETVSRFNSLHIFVFTAKQHKTKVNPHLFRALLQEIAKTIRESSRRLNTGQPRKHNMAENI